MLTKAVTPLLAAMLALAVTAADAQKSRKRERDAPAAPLPAAEKRDRVVTAPGNPFNGKAYWIATAQCGGIHFRLSALYTEAGITAKVVKPDRAAYDRLTKQSTEATRTATAYFDAAERFLIADRGLARDDAVFTYDRIASDAGDRLKTVDAALSAAKPCPALYQLCREAFPKICSEPRVSASRGNVGRAATRLASRDGPHAGR